MSTRLFRKSATDAQANKLDGDVIIAQPLSATLLTTAMIGFVVLVIVFLAMSSFNRKETVAGFLQPDKGISRLVAPRRGLISDILVADGDIVQQGQPLILLKTPEYLVDGGELNHLIASNFNQQVNLLNTRKIQLKEQFHSRQKELLTRIDFHESLLQDLNERRRLANQRLQLNQTRLTHLKTLADNGLVATEEIRQQQEIVLNVRQQLVEQRINEQTYRAQLQQLRGELERLPGDTEQQISLISSEISQLQQQQFELNARGQVLITAPSSGVVTNLLAEPGKSVQASDLLASIIPNEGELKAVLLIPTRAYGFVQTGQKTRIRFDAFPYQRFGLFEGQISKTSRSIVLPNEIDMPIVIQEPVYRVEVTLAMQDIRAYGESMPLQAGMLLSADVVLEQRSLLAWFLEPLLSLEGRI